MVLPRISLRLKLTLWFLAVFTVVFMGVLVAAWIASGETMEERSRLQGVFVFGAVASLVASSVAAWLVAGRAVQPMKQLVDAAGQVDAAHISARIDIKGEVEVERLKRALNDALARLEEGYRAQERFISNVAHDLKTPIAVMLTESQVLQPGYVRLEDFEQYRNSMIVEMQRLGGLVESFLTLARADQGAALSRMIDVPIIDVILEAVSECDSEAGQMEVRLVPMIDESGRPAEDLEFKGDPNLVRAMLVNLLRNAIRFSPPGETVEIQLIAIGETAEISVRDRGPGIPEEFHQSVFDRFVQTTPNETRGRGTGLGLAIAKSVAELHGGSIGIENCPDRGCIFTVRLPLDEPRREDVASRSTAR